MTRSLTALCSFAFVLVAPQLAHAAWQSQQIAGMGVEIYTPASTSPIGTGHGLMVALHGCTQTAVQLRDYAGLEQAAEDFGIVMAVPLVPNGGVVAGCWDYYGSLHTRGSGHNGPVIELVETMRDDAGYGIDPAQIYLAGFSAGGGQALVLGCLAPDLFAGVGVAAGPSVGTSISQIAQVGTTAQQAATVCQQFAGTHAADFATQIAVTFTDTGDATVAQGYAQVSADMFAIVYGGALQEAPFDMASLPGNAPAGSGTEYEDGDGARVATMTSTSGTGHNWPAGTGASSPPLSFVSGSGLDFAYYLGEFFTANSRRAEGEWMPGDDDGGSDEGGATAGEDDAGTGEGEVGSGDGAGTSGGEAGSDEDGEGGSNGASASATAGQSGGGTTDGYIEPSGCQCSHGRGRGGAGWLVLAIVGLVASRRRDRL